MNFNTVLKYIELGFTHVIPLGFDHILFILCLFFLQSNLRSVLWQCSIFTLAHSMSLGLASAGFFMPNSQIIEPLIALSILFTAVENILNPKLNNWRMILIFMFGLIHGFGFATALSEIGIPKKQFFSSLLSFNIGVEIGQITIILLAYFLISRPFSEKIWYRSRIVNPISMIIGCVALYWTIDRIFE